MRSADEELWRKAFDEALWKNSFLQLIWISIPRHSRRWTAVTEGRVLPSRSRSSGNYPARPAQIQLPDFHHKTVLGPWSVSLFITATDLIVRLCWPIILRLHVKASYASLILRSVKGRLFRLRTPRTWQPVKRFWTRVHLTWNQQVTCSMWVLVGHLGLKRIDWKRTTSKRISPKRESSKYS